jgi:predicted transport protein
VAWLKEAHGIGHGYANLIAIRARETASGGSSAPDNLVQTQYAGAKTALKPNYDNVIAVVQSFGSDVEVSPKKGYVSLRRTKQFAIVQPSTASRLDIGLNLKGVAPSGRLEASGSFNAMCTHRVRIEGKAGLDASVKKWLKQAYDAA